MVSSIRTTTRSSVISSRTGVSGPLPLAMPRTAISRSVIMPISRSPSVTGIEPASALSMKFAASWTGWSGRTVCTSRVITSLIFMVALPSRNSSHQRTVVAEGARLGHVFRKQVVGRDQFVALIEDFDRPADHAGIVALQRLGPHGQLDPHRIAGIKRGQEAKVLEAGIGQDRARIRI